MRTIIEIPLKLGLNEVNLGEESDVLDVKVIGGVPKLLVVSDSEDLFVRKESFVLLETGVPLPESLRVDRFDYFGAFPGVSKDSSKNGATVAFVVFREILMDDTEDLLTLTNCATVGQA